MFDLLKTCIIALRGYKKPSSTTAKIETLDMDLRESLHPAEDYRCDVQMFKRIIYLL